jgi:voltage-dependent calcium channel T type alpha-1G
MYSGIDAVGVDKQPVENYNQWMIVYFVTFLLLVEFFMFNAFIGVVMENIQKLRSRQKQEENDSEAILKRLKKLKKAVESIIIFFFKLVCLLIILKYNFIK